MDRFLFDNSGSEEISNKNSDQPVPWKLLVVDDEEDVHAVTRMALRGFEFENRPLQITNSYSKKEAIETLSSHNDFSLAIIDVVMETESAGLELIDYIRNKLGNHKIRLALRTGQPGQAPEARVITKYDINDYKNKTDLTSQSLRTLCFSAFRGYRDITTIEKSREGVQRVLSCSAQVLKNTTLSGFIQSLAIQVKNLINSAPRSVTILSQPRENSKDREINCLTLNQDVSNTESIQYHDLPELTKKLINRAIEQKCSQNDSPGYVAYFNSKDGHQNIICLQFSENFSQQQAELLALFGSNISLTFEMILKNEEIVNVQRQLVMLLGEAVESKSRETGAHVKRVSVVCEMLANDLGLNPDFTDLIKYSSPLHDIGKIAIPDDILHKPGKLDSKEWDVMKSHAEIGGKILSQSEQSVFKVASEIATKHHERWDGMGYPEGIREKEIPLEARIVSLVDVFDALGSKRSYKLPWPDKKIKEFIESQKSRMFDPTIVDVFLSNFDRYSAVRLTYPDEEHYG